MENLSPIADAARRRLSRIGLSFVVFFFVSYSLQFLLSNAVALLAPSLLKSMSFVFTLSIATMYAVAFPLFYLCLRSLPRAECGKRPMRIRDLCILFFISFSAMYITNLIGQSVNLLTEALIGSSSSAGATEVITKAPLYLTLIFAVVIGPIVEEVMFRGIILPRLLFFGERFAVFVSALLFGLFHGNFEQFFYAFAIGLIFGSIMAKTGKLRYTAVLHILLNLFGSVPSTLLTRYTAGMDLTQMGKETVLALLLTYSYAIFIVLAVAMGIFFLAKYAKTLRPRPAEHPIPREERRYLPLSLGGVLYILVLIALFVLSYL